MLEVVGVYEYLLVINGEESIVRADDIHEVIQRYVQPVIDESGYTGSTYQIYKLGGSDHGTI